MPPSGFSQKAINGLLIFIKECYNDLLEKIAAGEDKYGREVAEGKAIEKELKQIGEYLEKFTI